MINAKSKMLFKINKSFWQKTVSNNQTNYSKKSPILSNKTEIHVNNDNSQQSDQVKHFQNIFLSAIVKKYWLVLKLLFVTKPFQSHLPMTLSKAKSSQKKYLYAQKLWFFKLE